MARYRPGFDRKACAKCGHRLDLRRERDSVRWCVVYDGDDSKAGACALSRVYGLQIIR